MFFSYVPLRPIAPGSSPPCPGSIAIVIRLRLAADLGAGRAAGARSDGATEGDADGFDSAAARSSRNAISGSNGTSG